MRDHVIPFNLASFAGREQEYLQAAITTGDMAGNGPFTRRCQELLEQATGAASALLTTSCTHALEMSALLLGLKPGDEVIVPSFTFVSTINAFALRGARPIFADVRPDTLNLDESQLEALITERTRAIVVVHYAGVGCEMDEIMAIADRHQVPVVEDNAHGLFGRYRGRPLGSFGVLATQSFHQTKNVSCGEGGALLVNDRGLIERAEILREKGTDRTRFFRGQVDKYTWVDVGSSYVPSDLLAAILLGQLEAAEDIQRRRRELWERYDLAIRHWAQRWEVQIPSVPAHCEQAYHMYYILLPSLAVREQLIRHLDERSISAVFHYQPLHLSTKGHELGGRSGQCPVTEDVADRLLRLPFYNSLSEEEQDVVIATIDEFVPATELAGDVRA